MRQISIIVFALVAIGWTNLPAGDIYTLIKQGKLEEAGDSLSLMSSAALRDGRLLFFQSLLEKNGQESVRLMQAALNASVPARYQEEIYMRLAQYHLLQGDHNRLSTLVNEYRARWETGRYEDQMLRLSVLLNQVSGHYDAALRQADRYLLRYSEGDQEQWGQIDKARVLWAYDKGIGAIKTLRSLSRARSGSGVSQALYLLALDAIKRKRIDDAVFYYNLLREGYPGAVGLDHLVEQLGGMSTESTQDTQAEEITGTYYSVKIGVFSNKSNAKNHANTFKAYDKKIDIKSKTISGQKYQVVYIGRFTAFEDARQFKTQLEAAHGEVYQVVAR